MLFHHVFASLMDVKTPRTLLSSILKRKEPRQTIRRSPRLRSLKKPKHLAEGEAANVTGTTRHLASVIPSIVDNSEKTEATPRTFIDEIFRRSKVEKTVRQPSTTRASLRTSQKQESTKLISRALGSGSKQDQVYPESVINLYQSASKNENSSQKLLGADAMESRQNREILVTDYKHFQGSGWEPKIPRKRKKRIMLSELHLSGAAKETRLDSFTDDLITKVQLLVKRKLNNSKDGSGTKVVLHHQKRKRLSNPLLSSTRIYNESNFDASAHSKDAFTEADIDDMGEDSQTAIPVIEPSDVDRSSELGPLQLSGIMEEDAINVLGVENAKNDSASSKLRPGLSQTSSEQSLERPEAVNLSADHNSSIFPEALVQNISMTVAGTKSSAMATTHVSVDQKPFSMSKELSIKKITPFKRRKPVPNGLPISSRQLDRLVKRYATKKISRQALNQIEEVSRAYFEQTAQYLRQSRGSRRKVVSVNLNDVEILMKRRRHITRRKPLNVVIEENFPLEYRGELIPIATSGNALLNV